MRMSGSSDYGVSDRVRLVPRCSHEEAIATMKRADVAVLLGGSCIASRARIPGDVLEYVERANPSWPQAMERRPAESVGRGRNCGLRMKAISKE